MTKDQLHRLIKVEDRIHRIVEDDLGLKCYPIEFDIVPPQKMLEIMAYNIPTNISNWKKGRDYERERTIYDHSARGLPYEVVINANPARAYLMDDNKFAVQALVMAHVYGHCAFFSTNKYFINSRQDIVNIMFEASRRFLEYEKRYGIDEVERTEDAAHALQWHSSPFEIRETEDEKRHRIFEQEKKKIHARGGSYGDINGSSKIDIQEDIELFNQKLWRSLKLKTPVEPTEDILRYLIDNSRILEDWQKDIMEVLRLEGQYYWPIIKTKFMNEGFSVVVHEKVMNKLFEEGLLTSSEHADYNYSNSLVKGENPFQLNPYLVGSIIWKDIESRWDKGRHGADWSDCKSAKDKENWDTKVMGGWKKCLEVMESYTDWFFMMDFLTPQAIFDSKIYIYREKESNKYVDYVITKDEAEDIRKKIIAAFARTSIPKIEVVNGDYEGQGSLYLKHKWDGMGLDKDYATQTMDHVLYLWGKPVHLETKDDEGVQITWSVSIGEEIDQQTGIYEYWKQILKGMSSPLKQTISWG